MKEILNLSTGMTGEELRDQHRFTDLCFSGINRLWPPWVGWHHQLPQEDKESLAPLVKGPSDLCDLWLADQVLCGNMALLVREAHETPHESLQVFLENTIDSSRCFTNIVPLKIIAALVENFALMHLGFNKQADIAIILSYMCQAVAQGRFYGNAFSAMNDHFRRTILGSNVLKCVLAKKMKFSTPSAEFDREQIEPLVEEMTRAGIRNAETAFDKWFTGSDTISAVLGAGLGVASRTLISGRPENMYLLVPLVLLTLGIEGVYRSRQRIFPRYHETMQKFYRLIADYNKAVYYRDRLGVQNRLREIEAVIYKITSDLERENSLMESVLQAGTAGALGAVLLFSSLDLLKVIPSALRLLKSGRERILTAFPGAIARASAANTGSRFRGVLESLVERQADLQGRLPPNSLPALELSDASRLAVGEFVLLNGQVVRPERDIVLTAGIWLLEGPSGSGKSTLLNYLAAQEPGLINCQAGFPIESWTIALAGADCNLDYPLVEELIARLKLGQAGGFWDFIIRNIDEFNLHQTVQDQLKDTDNRQALLDFWEERYSGSSGPLIEVLNGLAAAYFRGFLPDFKQDMLEVVFKEEEAGSKGELKRLGLALALLNTGANLILIDEPVANLDPESRELITGRILDFAGRNPDKIIIIVNHDTRFGAMMHSSDRTLALRGRLVLRQEAEKTGLDFYPYCFSGFHPAEIYSDLTRIDQFKPADLGALSQAVEYLRISPEGNYDLLLLQILSYYHRAYLFGELSNEEEERGKRLIKGLLISWVDNLNYRFSSGLLTERELNTNRAITAIFRLLPYGFQDNKVQRERIETIFKTFPWDNILKKWFQSFKKAEAQAGNMLMQALLRPDGLRPLIAYPAIGIGENIDNAIRDALSDYYTFIRKDPKKPTEKLHIEGEEPDIKLFQATMAKTCDPQKRLRVLLRFSLFKPAFSEYHQSVDDFMEDLKNLDENGKLKLIEELNSFFTDLAQLDIPWQYYSRMIVRGHRVPLFTLILYLLKYQPPPLR